MKSKIQTLILLSLSTFYSSAQNQPKVVQESLDWGGKSARNLRIQSQKSY